MERGSSKHGPRLDEQMDREVRGLEQGGTDPRAEDRHPTEPPGDDEPDANWAPVGYDRAGTPPGMTWDEVEGRSELGRFIPRAALPGDRDELLAGARRLEAPDSVIAQLERLPADRTYATVNDMWEALGHHNEERRT
jgi:hypothetical protein